MLTDRFLVELAYEMWLRYNDFWAMLQERRHRPAIQPELPVPSGALPWWKRLRERLSPPELGPSLPNLVHPDPTLRKSEPAGSLLGAVPAAVRPPEPSQALATARTASVNSELLTPRIVGGAQDLANTEHSRHAQQLGSACRQ